MTDQLADPKRTHAMLVGIEKYAGGWNLNGPLRDVIEIRKWLCDSGVPADQIKSLVSAADENKSLLEQSGLDAKPATAEDVRGALKELHKVQGKNLLFIFWAGHGFNYENRHCLLLADATPDDKRNFDLDAMRLSLQSDYFPGFPRQIIIVDACANYERFDVTPPSEELPKGAPLSHEQFSFFAAQPGQVAKNIGEEKRGLFSRELLKQIHNLSASSWPPDMRSLAERVQGEFVALRASGHLAQTPIYEWSRDWDGNEIELKTSSLSGSERRSQKEPWELTNEQLYALTDALMTCSSMSVPEKREDVLRQIRADIRGAVPRRSDTKSDVMNMVMTASEYPGGLEELLRPIWYQDRERAGWRKVEKVIADMIPKLAIPSADSSGGQS